MHSDSLASWPYSIDSYAWKSPAAAAADTRPPLFKVAQRLLAARDVAAQPGNPVTVSWKAYLASRHLQMLASELGDALFSRQRPGGPCGDIASAGLDRPAIFSACSDQELASGEPRSQLLASVLPQAGVSGECPADADNGLQDMALAA
jgi:hypothetical protein